MIVPGIAHRLWQAASWPAWRRFRAALLRPEERQRRVLRRILERNAGSSFGRVHGFDRISDRRDLARHLPLQSWDDVAPWVERIRGGEPGVLTTEPVRRLVPTSGSTAGAKAIPTTASFERELARAVAAWTHDLFRRLPSLVGTLAYWSVSPRLGSIDGDLPSGLEDDAAALGSGWAALVRRTLAVPAWVGEIGDLDVFRYVTLWHLLGCRELGSISIWHPSFADLLLEAREAAWGSLLADLEHGTLTPPGQLAPGLAERALRGVRPRPERAAELAALGPDAAPARYWPRLAHLSAWGDAQAARGWEALAARFPGVEVERKGLLATESCVTIPWRGAHPIAVDSHFVELLDDDGRSLDLDAVEIGGEYEVALTTGGGLYRYRLGDRVRVDGRVGATPSLHLVGRVDARVDLVGEKLDDAFVAAALDRALPERPAFAMLAPDPHSDGRAGYTLFVDVDAPQLDGVAARLERALAANPYYEQARRLGQLAPLRVYGADPGGDRRYLARLAERGAVLGAVKPVALSPLDGWAQHLPGCYVPPDPLPTKGGEGRVRGAGDGDVDGRAVVP